MKKNICWIPKDCTELSKNIRFLDLYIKILKEWARKDDLAEFWHRDAVLMERNFEVWELGRKIDAWLVTYRDHPRVGVEQYQRNCQRLRDLYHSGPRIETANKEQAA